MKFNYSKTLPLIVHADDEGTVHRWNLENSTFRIVASKRGVMMMGESPLFQPEEGEVHMPIEQEFHHFFARLKDAFEMSWKEQEDARKQQIGRKALLEVR